MHFSPEGEVCLHHVRLGDRFRQGRVDQRCAFTASICRAKPLMQSQRSFSPRAPCSREEEDSSRRDSRDSRLWGWEAASRRLPAHVQLVRLSARQGELSPSPKVAQH